RRCGRGGSCSWWAQGRPSWPSSSCAGCVSRSAGKRSPSARACTSAWAHWRSCLAARRGGGTPLVGWRCGSPAVSGFWGSGFLSFDVRGLIFEPVLAAEGFDARTREFKLTLYVGWTSVLQNLGGFVGIQGYLWLTQRTTRRFAFAVSFVAALFSTAFTYSFLG